MPENKFHEFYKKTITLQSTFTMALIVMSISANFDDETIKKPKLCKEKYFTNYPTIEVMAKHIDELPMADTTDETVSMMKKEDEDVKHYISTLRKLDQVTLEHQNLGISQDKSQPDPKVSLHKKNTSR